MLARCGVHSRSDHVNDGSSSDGLMGAARSLGGGHMWGSNPLIEGLRESSWLESGTRMEDVFSGRLDQDMWKVEH